MGGPTDPVNRTFVIGISGFHNSGKTTLTNNLIHDLGLAYQQPKIYVLRQSDFTCEVEKSPARDPFLCKNDSTDIEKKWRDCANPAVVKSAFFDIIKDMGKGKGYDKCKLVRDKHPTAQDPVFDRFVIVEGTFLFHDYSTVKDLFDLKIFLDVKPDVALARRAGRPEPEYKPNNVGTYFRYWFSKRYYEAVMWPGQKLAHKKIMARQAGGIEIESSGRTVAQTRLWAKNLAQKYIQTQVTVWSSAHQIKHSKK